MNTQLLRKHVKLYLEWIAANPQENIREATERQERRQYYQAFTKDKLIAMSEDGFFVYISKLWAMLIWGNKQYKVDQIIEQNGFDNIKRHLAELLYGEADIAKRWDAFRKSTKGIGPAMMSELLSHVRPGEYMIINTKAITGYRYLGIPNLPNYEYQKDGRRYNTFCEHAKAIAQVLREENVRDVDLLHVDYFIWWQLQHEPPTPDPIRPPQPTPPANIQKETGDEEAEFIHNEVRDKLRDIGEWLGFTGEIEKTITAGTRVDTTWQSTIGNMGRVIYVFEVQTKGSIDSLLINLMQALNNPAVQGIVSVSDEDQNRKIKERAATIPNLSGKLKFWDYREVLRVHESLSNVNESINNLGLVPKEL